MTDLVFLAMVDACIWLVWSIAMGYVSTKLPQSLFMHNLFPTNKYTERIWRCVGIKKWKDFVPEAGAAFKGGVSKKQLLSLNREGLEKFVYETRRAELAHYLMMSITPIFFLFNPPILLVGMVAYAFFANVPFIGIQRYNRARIQRALG